jgi:hypothetical protein
MLKELVTHADGFEDDALPWASAMRDMLRRHERNPRYVFSEKQEVYVAGIYEKIFDDPQYENAFSAGKVPVGEKLRTVVPDVLRKPLPKRPPGKV